MILILRSFNFILANGGDIMNNQELLLARAYELLTEWCEEGESEETLEQLYQTVEELKRIGYKFK